MNARDVKKLAKRRYDRLSAREDTVKYNKVIGKLVAANLLESNHIDPYRGPVDLNSVLQVGEIEPRVLEVLPAILLKKPKLIKYDILPDDLEGVLHDIRRGRRPTAFRGIEPDDYLKWIDKVGHKGKSPTLLKTFRFNVDDLHVLERLKEKHDTSEIKIIRMALRHLAERH